MSTFNSTADCQTDSDSDTESPSLPSLPASLQQQLEKGKTPYQIATTVKEVEEKLAELRRENFNLKLRLYFVEKDRHGITKPEYESVVAKEMAKREKTIKAYEKIVNDQQEKLETLEKLYDKEMSRRDVETERMRTENENLLSDLHVNASVCRSLMSHLNEIREYWKNHLLNSSNAGMTDLLASLSNWFNSSEDLLNSASVLIQDDCTQNLSHQRENSIFDASQAGNNYANKILLGCPNYSKESILPEQNLQYLKCKEQLYQISSDSEEEWSEPDREAAKARMGFVDAYAREHVNRSPPKPRRKRRSSGMSSLGLLPNVSEMMMNKSGKRSKTDGKAQGIQTDLTLLTLDAILYDYQSLVSKEIADSCTQTVPLPLVDGFTQTSPAAMCHQSVGTEVQSTANRYTQIETTYEEAEAQTEIKTIVNNASQTDPRTAKSKSQSRSSLVLSDEECLPFPEIRAKGSVSETIDELENGRTNKTLYTYKAYLSPLKKSPPSSPTSVKSTAICSDAASNGLRKTSNHCSRQSLNSQKVDINPTPSSVPKSFPSSPIKRSPEVKQSILPNADHRPFTTANDKSTVRVKKATISKSSRLNLLNKDNYGRNDLEDDGELIRCIQCSSSSSSVDGKHSPRSKTAKVRQSLTLEMAKISNIFNNPDHGAALSSPDLGLGDSDQDLNGSLRAYLSLSNYQLLRRNINEALSVITTMENLSRDFSLQVIKVCDYYNEMNCCISNIVQIISSSTSICRSFRVEDMASMMTELEQMKNKKENMEKAITRQLIKTDRLLKKAKVNLKDN